MPELPDITIYIEALEGRVFGRTLERVRVASPFLLRTAVPPLTGAHGRKVTSLRRLGKRLAFGLEGDWWLVLHLMIAGRLHWRQPSRRRFSGEGHGLPSANGGPWQVRPAVSDLWRQGAAHPLPGQRDELLSRLPDRRQAARRPLSLVAVEEGLAQDAGRTGATAENRPESADHRLGRVSWDMDRFPT